MKYLSLASILMALLLWNPSSFAKDKKAFHALVVSAETSYLKSEARLNYAELDADRVARAMRKAGRTPPSYIHRLKNPTSADLNRYIRRMSKKGINKFLFYFSGHSDENGLHLKDGLIDKRRFHSMMKSITSKVKVVILDSCFSGALKTKGVKKSKAIELVQYNVDEPTGSVVLTSSSGREFSYESENLKGSIFTYHLVSGIYGQADGNEDGLVTIDELYQYVYSQTKYQNMVSGGAVQHPEFDSKLTGQGALVVSFPARINGRIKLPKGLHGELTLAAANGVTFFKFFKAKGEDRAISLPYGTYDVTVNEPSRVGTGRIELLSDEQIRLRDSDLVWKGRSQEKIQAKGVSTKLAEERPNEFIFGLKLSSHPGFSETLDPGGSSELVLLSPTGQALWGRWRLALHGGTQSHEIKTTNAKVEFSRFTIGTEGNYSGIPSWNNDWIIGFRVGVLGSETPGLENAALSHLTFGTRFHPTSFPLKFGVHLGFEGAEFTESKQKESVTTLGFSVSY